MASGTFNGDIDDALFVPPHNADAEVGLLGSILYFNEAIEQIDFQPDHFYLTENRIVAETIVTMWQSGCRALDVVTLGEELQRTGRLEPAGGVPYLFKLTESVPHAKHVKYYADIVREKYDRRSLIESCSRIISEARRPDSNITHVVEHTKRLLQESRIGSGKDRLPVLTFHDAWEASHQPKPLRECIIEGMLRRGEVGNFIAATKVGKSWFALQLLFSVSTGRDWLGRRVLEGPVLLIDNELHEETIENRMAAVRFKMDIGTDTPRAAFDYVACRGNWLSLLALMEQVRKQYQPGSLNLIVIDAKYRLFGEGLQENSNDDQTTFGNMIDRFAAELNCPVVLVHHSTKGDQSTKSVADVGSGGGSQARTVDLHMTIRPHQQPEYAVLDAIVRSFMPVKPMTIKFNWPLWTVVTDVEPALPTNAKDHGKHDEVKSRILKYLTEDWQSLSKLAERCSTKRDRNPFADIIDKLQAEGAIEIDENYIPPRRKTETTGIRLTPDKTTSDSCPQSLSTVRG